VNVSLTGIASMQKNVKKTSVIYAVPQEGDGRLRSLCSNSPHSIRLTRFTTIKIQGRPFSGD
jgi:hypothetical protein